MIAMSMDSELGGLITEKRTVSTIIYSALTAPHNIWRSPDRKVAAIMFDVMKVVIADSTPYFSDSIRALSFGSTC